MSHTCTVRKVHQGDFRAFLITCGVSQTFTGKGHKTNLAAAPGGDGDGASPGVGTIERVAGAALYGAPEEGLAAVAGKPSEVKAMCSIPAHDAATQNAPSPSSLCKHPQYKTLHDRFYSLSIKR